MNALKNFVMARMLFDPTLNSAALIEDFLRGYYYAAAPHVREYMALMHRAVQKEKFYMNEGIPSNAPIYTAPNLLGCAQVRRTPSRPDVGPTSAFSRCTPTVMYGPTCIFWANLTPFSLQAMAKAVAAVRAEPPRVRLRVDAAKVSTYYIVMVHWSSVQAYARKAGVVWPLESTKEAAWAEFSRVWNATGMTVASEFHCDLPCVRAQLFEYE